MSNKVVSLTKHSAKVVKKIEKAAIFVQKILERGLIRIILVENVLGLKIICIALFDNALRPTASNGFSLLNHNLVELSNNIRILTPKNRGC